MNLTRHKLFTDARRTAHQYRRVGGRHPFQVRQQLPRDGAGSYQALLRGHQWISASFSSTGIRRPGRGAAGRIRGAVHGVDLGHARAHDDIGIGYRLILLAAACVPGANHNHRIVDQLLRAGIRLRSAGDAFI